MSTPDQPETPQLTRRQLRELRNTASTPVITPEAAQEAAEAAAATPPVVAPLARAAEPVDVPEAPPAAADVDIDAPVYTRRAARRQERLRTASVPVFGAADEAGESGEAVVDEHHAPADETAEAAAEAAHEENAPVEVIGPPADVSDTDAADAPKDEAPGNEAGPVLAESAEAEESGAGSAESDAAETEADTTTVAADDASADVGADVDDTATHDDRPVVAPTFGSGLLAGDGVELELPASFDQLLTRGSTATGALSAPNALILSQTPETGAFVSPITGTGEVLITGTFSLPESFGSTGTMPGRADNKETDAVLVDGELPASSSPTPIAASSAISTIKSAEDIIKPPAPEKGSRLMLALVITAGALALALTGVLLVALLTGAIG